MDVDAVVTSADECAEKTHQMMTWIAKSNSLLGYAKEKSSELKAVDGQLDAKLVSLKNSG